MDKNLRCPAILKDGRPCRNKGRLEYEGRCGIHRTYVPIEIASTLGSSGESLKRLERLVTISGGLILLTEKAVQYLPDLIEVLVRVSEMAFMAKDEVSLRRAMRGHPENGVLKKGGIVPPQIDTPPFGQDPLVKMRVNPKHSVSLMKRHVEEGLWQHLAWELDRRFDQIIESGNVPRQLLDEINVAKSQVLAELRGQGFNPTSTRSPRTVAPGSR